MWMLVSPVLTGLACYSCVSGAMVEPGFITVPAVMVTWREIKFPFKRKALTSHNVKFLKCLQDNNHGQFKVDNKSTILVPASFLTIRKVLHGSETTIHHDQALMEPSRLQSITGEPKPTLVITKP